MTKTDFTALFAAADAAGKAAVVAMGEVDWYPCGFAWVVIRPGNSAAAKYAKANLGARAGYGGGMHLWIPDYNQSMTLKAAYADAFAKVLVDAGIRATSHNRMD